MRFIEEMSKATAAKVMAQEKLPEYNRDSKALAGLEDALREALSPDVPTYDVFSCQNINFSEWCYTEGMGCLIAQTQSAEINARLMLEAAQYDGPVEDHVTRLRQGLRDKWRLQGGTTAKGRKVFFPPGDNMTWVINMDNVQREFDREPAWMVKPHPIVNPPGLRAMKLQFGVHRMYDPMCSGMALLYDADTVGFTTASELGVIALLLDKPAINFSRYEYEAVGRYHAFYLALDRNPGTPPAVILNRVLSCEWSGIVPLHVRPDVARGRFAQFKSRTEELRDHYKPIVTHTRFPNTRQEDENGGHDKP